MNKQNKFTMFERIEGENRIYALELQTNPPRKSFRVLEAEVAKSLSSELSAHHNNPNIANFGNEIVSQNPSDCQTQGNLDTSDSNFVEEIKSTLEIFELGFHFARALGGEALAIADLKVLFERHKDDGMFNDLGDVSNVIKSVIENPEVIINANKTNEPYTIIKALTRLNSRKMGDIIIKNQDSLNEIFHANKKKISEFTRLVKKLQPRENMIDGEDTQSSRPDENQVRVAGTNDVRSSTNKTIPQNPSDCQTQGNLDTSDSNNESTQTIYKRRK